MAAVQSRRYHFIAQTVLPQRGETRQLTGNDYDISVLPDSVICYLPYFGKAYTTPYNPTDVGIKFTSTKFYYDTGNWKKGSCTINIRPKDNSNIQRLVLTIFDNGNAAALVITNCCDPINYEGYLDVMLH